MAVDTIFIGITICGTENVPVPDSAQGSEFLGINRCGGDPSPTPSQSPDGTCDFVFVIEDAPIIVSPSPSPTPSITPTPSNLGVAYSFLGFAWDSGSLCDKNTVFNAFAHASQVTGGSCNIIPLNFYTDINLSIPFDGGYKWFKVPCAVAGDYRNLIFSISSQGERGDIMEIQCVPYPSPSPTSSTTPSVTPTNSPSQTPDATCDFMFVIEDVPTTASPSPTQSPIPSPSPTPSNTPSPTPSSSSNSMLAVPIYNISNVPEGSTICSYNGILRTVYVRNQNDKDSIQNLELNPVGVAIWSDSAGTLSYGVMAPDFEAGPWSTSQAVAVGAIRRSISIEGNTGQISSVNDMNC